jgi:hypothetical protein
LLLDDEFHLLLHLFVIHRNPPSKRRVLKRMKLIRPAGSVVHVYGVNNADDRGIDGNIFHSLGKSRA